MSAGVSITFSMKDEKNKLQDYNVWLYSTEDLAVNSSVQVVEHPLVTGDKVMDHMYRDADTLTVRGVIGKLKSSGVVNEKVYDLSAFQKLFKRVKDNGVVCQVVKFIGDAKNTSNFNFEIHQNVVVTHIAWTEQNTTLGYNISFKEVMFAETVETQVDVDDNLLPNIQYPEEKSFVESIFNKEKCEGIIINWMHDNDFISDEFYNSFWNWQNSKTEYIVGAVAAVATGLLVYAGTAASLGSLAGPVGMVAGALAGLLVFAIGKGIQEAVVACKYKIHPFEEWNEKERNRFIEFLNSLDEEFNKLNDKIKVYQLSSESDHQVVLSIGNNYFTFQFTTNNTNKSKEGVIFDQNEKQIMSMDLFACPTDISTYKEASGKMLIIDDQYVFIAYIGEDSEDAKTNLKNYVIVISTIKPTDMINAVIDIVKRNIFRDAA